MRVLITGITGFVGSHMAEHALSQGAEVFGISRGQSTAENIEHLRGRITLIESDLRDDASVRSLVARSSPDYVVHLAAQSVVGASWQAPAETLADNILSQVNLLEAIRSLAVPPRFLCVGSSEEYGMVYEEELPIRETNPLRPLSPYAVSKVTQDVMGYQYFKSYGLPIVRTRAFSHEGPRRGDVFMTSNFAKQVAEIEAGRREPVVRVGDLKPRRDFSDVRDVVRGYWLLLERGEPGEVYNLCSGRAWSIQQVLELPDRRVHGEGDRRRGRSGTPPALRRDDPRGRPVEDREGHGVEGDDSLRAHPQRAPRLLAGAGPARRALIGSDAMRVALVHDWLTGMRGGERCLEAFCELFPEADLFTLVHVPGSVSPVVERRRITTSFIQRLPGAAAGYRRYLPLFPAAIRRFDLRGYDLVLSSSHAVAKSVPVPAGTLHVCYCFTPMRYVWDLYDEYFGPRAGWAMRAAMPPVAAALRRWDRRTAAGVHHFVAISRFVADRIRRAYGRSADVIYPPVDVARFAIDESPGDYYLVVSALAPYKRVDLAVEAANRTRRRLLVVGTRPRGAAACAPSRVPPSRCSAGGTTTMSPGCTGAVGRWSSPRSRISGSRRSRPWPREGRCSRSDRAAPRRPSCRRAAPSRPPASSSRGRRWRT